MTGPRRLLVPTSASCSSSRCSCRDAAGDETPAPRRPRPRRRRRPSSAGSSAPADGCRLVFRVAPLRRHRGRLGGRRRGREPHRRPVAPSRGGRRGADLVRRDAVPRPTIWRSWSSRSADGDLPGLRAASTYTPALPARLVPGAHWRGTIAAPGSLAAGLYVRLVLGPFVAVGDPPDGMERGFSWITDHAHRLKG